MQAPRFVPAAELCRDFYAEVLVPALAGVPHAAGLQRLLGVVAGPVFADPDGELADARRRLRRYPDAVWWWVMACQWQRIAQEEPFVQRTAEVGDQLGSAVVTARLVRDVMRLALLMARRYPPYSKWLGSAFSRLRAAPRGQPGPAPCGRHGRHGR